MRVGSIVYATNQGLGHLAKSFYDADVVNDVMIFKHPHGERTKPTQTQWYPTGTQVVDRPFTGELFERFLDDLDVILFFETPFDWQYVNRCRERGVKTAIIPMYEWFPINPPAKFDLFLNPSLLDQEYFPQGQFIPIPVEDPISWTLKTVAKKFLHNAGNIGSRNHKGTEELLKSMEYVESPIELTVRCQNTIGIQRLRETIPSCKTDPRIKFVDHEIPREELFNCDFDVYIAPEKYNGLSLPLQEAYASGMPVITSDRFPMNTWLDKELLVKVSGTRNVQVAAGHLEIQESIIEPISIAAKIDEIYGQDISRYSMNGLKFKTEHSWKNLRPKFDSALESINGK